MERTDSVAAMEEVEAEQSEGEQLDEISLSHLELLDSAQESLGKGSFGIVQRVRRKGTDKVYALKTMRKQEVIEGNLINQVELEIRVQRRLKHRNVLRLYRHLEDVDNVYLMLEYCEKGELYQILRMQRCRRFPEAVACRFFIQVAEGLHYLHQNSVVHRDIKPENLLVDHDDVLKIADFGWCAVSNTLRTTFCGTLDYLAPEMIQGRGHDHTLDIWGAGVLLYEMIVGRPPFQSTNHAQLISKILALDLRFPGFVSAGVQELVRSLLRREPRERMSLQVVLRHPWTREHARQSSKESTPEHPDDVLVRSKGITMDTTRDPCSEPSLSESCEVDNSLMYQDAADQTWSPVAVAVEAPSPNVPSQPSPARLASPIPLERIRRQEVANDPRSHTMKHGSAVIASAPVSSSNLYAQEASPSTARRMMTTSSHGAEVVDSLGRTVGPQSPVLRSAQIASSGTAQAVRRNGVVTSPLLRSRQPATTSSPVRTAEVAAQSSPSTRAHPQGSDSQVMPGTGSPFAVPSAQTGMSSSTMPTQSVAVVSPSGFVGSCVLSGDASAVRTSPTTGYRTPPVDVPPTRGSPLTTSRLLPSEVAVAKATTSPIMGNRVLASEVVANSGKVLPSRNAPVSTYQAQQCDATMSGKIPSSKPSPLSTYRELPGDAAASGKVPLKRSPVSAHRNVPCDTAASGKVPSAKPSPMMGYRTTPGEVPANRVDLLVKVFENGPRNHEQEAAARSAPSRPSPPSKYRTLAGEPASTKPAGEVSMNEEDHDDVCGSRGHRRSNPADESENRRHMGFTGKQLPLARRPPRPESPHSFQPSARSGGRRSPGPNVSQRQQAQPQQSSTQFVTPVQQFPPSCVPKRHLGSQRLP
uniref:Aurora kinase n=1 Tax=Noctiluca scintillans TaxID=2966 RepID=A0A6T8XE74_NOCSC|mmetsp:Transcript_30506/g.81227  ORF Transcript_30506/g.81227 Transcript_30506/m.81227 type:complete len:867 (+) Transcript_30506:74-2674(+)